MSISSKLSLFICCFLLAACTAPLPKNLEAPVEDQNVITDYNIWKNSSADTKSYVRLAGIVVNTKNLKEKTRVEVANIPIDKTGRPNIDISPRGRYIVYIDGFVDPLTLSAKKYVTFVGQTQADEKGHIGEFDYNFPVMKATGMRIWQVENVSVVNSSYDACFRYGYHGRHGGFYPGFCGSYGPQRIDTYKRLN